MLDGNEVGATLNTYTVEITETLQLSAECTAGSAEEAEVIIQSRYNDGAYILGSEHFTRVDFIVSEKKGAETDGTL